MVQERPRAARAGRGPGVTHAGLVTKDDHVKIQCRIVTTSPPIVVQVSVIGSAFNLNSGMARLASLAAGLALARAGTCDATIPGTWYCSSCSPQEEYVAKWNTSAGPGAFSFSSDSRLGWQFMYGQLAPDNATASAVFSNGQKAVGNLSSDCNFIEWSGKLGTWEAYTPPYEYITVHLCPHTHDDVGWVGGILLGRCSTPADRHLLVACAGRNVHAILPWQWTAAWAECVEDHFAGRRRAPPRPHSQVFLR